jgi:hypothetical protein
MAFKIALTLLNRLSIPCLSKLPLRIYGNQHHSSENRDEADNNKYFNKRKTFFTA